MKVIQILIEIAEAK